MRRFLIFALAVCTLSITAYAQKKEKKEKKEKSEKIYEWTWDGVKSGNEKVDNYLVTIDTLWNKIQNYGELMEKYHFGNENSTPDTLTINGKHYAVAYMKDKDGNLVTRATCNWQLVTSISNGIAIGSQALKATAMGASAATALPSLGMKALTYGKYLKGAPDIISLATKEIKEVVGKQKKNAQKWKSLKDGALTEKQLAELKDEDGNRVFSDKAIKNMQRCMYISLVPEIELEHAVNKDILLNKSKEEIQKENQDFDAWVAQNNPAPEDEKTTLETLPSDDELLED